MPFALRIFDEAKPDLCNTWVTLHAVFKEWQYYSNDHTRQTEIATHLERQLNELNVISNHSWRSLLELQGVTPIGLAALSWTQGAHLKDVIPIWASIRAENLLASIEEIISLHFINQELLPSPTFSAFLKAGFKQKSEWLFLASIFEGQSVKKDEIQGLDPEVISWFRTV